MFTRTRLAALALVPATALCATVLGTPASASTAGPSMSPSSPTATTTRFASS